MSKKAKKLKQKERGLHKPSEDFEKRNSLDNLETNTLASSVKVFQEELWIRQWESESANSIKDFKLLI